MGRKRNWEAARDRIEREGLLEAVVLLTRPIVGLLGDHDEIIWPDGKALVERRQTPPYARQPIRRAPAAFPGPERDLGTSYSVRPSFRGGRLCLVVMRGQTFLGGRRLTDHQLRAAIAEIVARRLRAS